jgi:hypothetical protein
MYYAGVYPYNEREMNRKEVFNEVMLMILTYHMLLFTDFITDPQLQFDLGKSFIFFLYVMVGMNLTFLMKVTVDKCLRKRKLNQMLE